MPRYSGQVAGRILPAMEGGNGMSQNALAEIVHLTPGYIKKVLKGNENLSLKTIAKLSDALGTELITFPEYKDDYIGPSGITVAQY